MSFEEIKRGPQPPLALPGSPATPRRPSQHPWPSLRSGIDGRGERTRGNKQRCQVRGKREGEPHRSLAFTVGKTEREGVQRGEGGGGGRNCSILDRDQLIPGGKDWASRDVAVYWFYRWIPTRRKLMQPVPRAESFSRSSMADFFFSFRASEGNCQSHHHAPYSISEKNTSIRDTTAAIHIPRQHNFPSHRARGRGLAWKNTTRRPSLVHRIGNMRLPGPAVSARELTSNHGWRADPVRAGPSTVTRTRTASTRHTVSAPLSLPLSPLAALPSPPPPS